jgi:hypothetical protein
VAPYNEEFINCLSEIAQYIYDKNGKFSGSLTTIVLPGFVQAQHIDKYGIQAFRGIAPIFIYISIFAIVGNFAYVGTLDPDVL